MGPLSIRFVVLLLQVATLVTSSHGFVPLPCPAVNHRSAGGFSQTQSVDKPGGPLFAEIMIQRGCQFYSINYDFIERQGSNLPPVVILHGGPGVPSNYLRPLEDLITDRSLLFWDQLGCGKSDRPEDESLYSIDLYVDDLVQLLEELEIPDFHLYGQSFGGILAFEYLKRERPETCKSVVLSSAPTDVPLVETEANALLQVILDEGTGPEDLQEEFRKRHQVRTESQPQPLADAYELVGTVFRGTDVIADYQASLSDNESTITIPALAMRGETDFVSTKNIHTWLKLFEDIQQMELKDCSHHGMLEKPEEYGKILTTFWKLHDS